MHAVSFFSRFTGMYHVSCGGVEAMCEGRLGSGRCLLDNFFGGSCLHCKLTKE